MGKGLSSVNFGRVAVLLGGTSNERDISLKSGKAVLEALQRKGVDVKGVDTKFDDLEQLKLFDKAFICLHGKDGEDGVIQKFLGNIGLPYTGNGVEASALCMDKYKAKLAWQISNVLTPHFLKVTGINDFDKACKICKLPFILKPSNSGSSLGVSIVSNKKDFLYAYEEARVVDKIVIAESYIDGKEYTLPVINDKPFPIIEIKPKNKLYDFESKYLRDDTEFICPADLSSELIDKINVKSIKAFNSLGCSGWGRVDFMIDKQSNIFFIEVNTIPGMTNHSLVPMSAKQAGIEFDDLVLKILKEASA